MTRPTDAITKAVAYVETVMVADGDFVTELYPLPAPTPDTKPQLVRTTFMSSLIAGCLEACDLPMAAKLRQSVVDYLLDQPAADGAFNYWDKNSPEYQRTPYPNDIDDTALAWVAIQAARPAALDGSVQAQLAGLLIACEHQTGGPYRTWLVAQDAPVGWLGLDPAVNANVAFLLARLEVQLPKLETFLTKAIKQNELTSDYYPERLSTLYFLSRLKLPKASRQCLIQLVQAELNQTEDAKGGLRMALALSSLQRLGHSTHSLQALRQTLLARQAADGSWPAAGFWLDSSRQGSRLYGGSRALSTAFCVEALCLSAPTEPPPASKRLPKSETHYQAVVQAVERTTRTIQPALLRRHIQTMYQIVLGKDKDRQVILMPWLVAEAVGQPIPKAVATQLALISLWGWTAYTAQDDILDNDRDNRLLPATNTAMRYLVSSLHASLPRHTWFQAEAARLLHRVDAANAWELAHCRPAVQGNILQLVGIPDYQDYWQLADRSIGHAIAGLGVLCNLGYSPRSREIRGFKQFFYHYLIARQLSDDMHDWEEDLAAGHINAVAAAILRTANILPNQTLHLAERRQELQASMWRAVIVDSCRDLQQHIDMARQGLQLFAKGDPSVFESILQRLEAAGQKALSERAAALAFIAEF